MTTPRGPYRGRSLAAARRGFTLLETVVAIALMVLLMAFSFPQLNSARQMAQDMQAKSVANSVVDTIMTKYGQYGAAQPWDTGSSPARPPQPDISSRLITATNSDVSVTASGMTPSADSSHASVGLYWFTDHWRFGVAVAAWPRSQSLTAPAVCWMYWRDVDGPDRSAVESFYVFDMSSAIDLTHCTGDVAARLAVPIKRDLTGQSWGKPLQATSDMVDTAVSLL